MATMSRERSRCSPRRALLVSFSIAANLCFLFLFISKNDTFRQATVTLLHKTNVDPQDQETVDPLLHKKHINSREEQPLNETKQVASSPNEAPREHSPHESKQQVKSPPKTEPTTYFLVIAKQRTGSGFLTTLLNSHSSIKCGSEKLKSVGNNEQKLKATQYADKIEETFQLLSNKGSCSHDPSACPSTVGFKIMYNQGISHFGKDIISWFRKNDIRIIHLIRRNKLQHYFSDKANHYDKKRNNGGHQAHPKSEQEASRIDGQFQADPDPKLVLSGLEKLYQSDRQVEHILSPLRKDDGYYMKVFYEDLVNRTDEVMSSVQTFLGVPIEKLETHLTKIHKKSQMRDYFLDEGREKLETALAKSKFDYVLEDW